MRIPLLLPLTAAALMSAGTVVAKPEFPIDIEAAEQRALERFEAADTNDDGVISQDEFIARMNDSERAPRADRNGRLGRSAAPYADGSRSGMRPPAPPRHLDSETRALMEERVFATLDVDGNGELSREEASAEARKAAHKSVRAELAFEHLDADGSGSLEQGELPNRVARLRELDSDGDGLVTREEIHSGDRTRGWGARNW